MKKIEIENLSLNNFKGIKSLKIDFKNETDIYGANGTGKTTIADAVNWLWFGKDSLDRKDFEIKTLDFSGKVIPMIEHEVSAVYTIDGDTVTMRRILKENWVKKRGSLESEFSGNVTECYWNDVPMLVTDFNKKVNAILDEQLFKMITSPIYFNMIDWKLKRTILTAIAGEVSDEEIAAGNPAYTALLANLTQGKTLEDYKAQITASIKKAKDDLKAIPTRIDEVTRQKPEVQDFAALEKERDEFQKQLDKVDGDLANASTAFQSKLDAQKGLRININNVEIEIKNIETEARNEARTRLTPDTSALDTLTKSLSEKDHEYKSYQNAVQTLTGKKTSLEAEIKALDVKIQAKRDEWGVENAKELTFNDGDCQCPTCKQDLPAGDVEAKKEEAIATFKANKNKTLTAITTQGKAWSDEKENLQNEVDGLVTRINNGNTSMNEANQEIERIKSEIASLNNVSATDLPSEELVYESVLSLHPTYKTKKEKLETLKGQLVEVPTVDNTELVTKRKELVDKIDNIKGSLNLKTQIDSCDNRIAELKKEESTLAQQIVDVEKIQFTIENFIKEKIDRLEATINDKFKMVNFKMFEEQINGGLRETCVAMVNGVPYTDLNTASKMNAGIDIINTLCEFYQVKAPIFIDNAESVHTLIETDSQLVRLVVSEMHKQLEVKSKELAA